MRVELHTRDVPWPDTPDGAFARAYLEPLLAGPVEAFVHNVWTEVAVLIVDGRTVLPITVNDDERGNAWVCSPYTHYVTYAKEELYLLDSRATRAVLGVALDALGLLARFSRLDRVVTVNNWLLSTNLYPALEPGQIAAVVAFLRERFPSHAIVFPSVNEPFAEGGLLHVPGRQVYLIDPGRKAGRSRKRWRYDLRLIERHGYEVIEPDDPKRVVELYNLLYLDKYSRNNPQFTERFVGELPFTLRGLAKDGRLDAVLGYYERDGVITTPIFGYDTALPRELGLYRMLSALLYQIAVEHGWQVNDSAGAGEFKRLRGAEPCIEYRAVGLDHLPWRRRVAWVGLEQVLRRVAVPMMREKGL
ncbi:hypothetical protein [Nonomuraea sp. NPDC050310]|uniref:hypothetical protein n=1 Tax=Nonomuraea sp. NPDC050310 TaxID=3154935 RepID=UPI0033D40FFE